MLDRIAAWIVAAGMAEYRLVNRGEVIDSVKLDNMTERDADDIAVMFDSVAEHHASSDGRPGIHVYTIVGERDGMTEECRFRITKTPENAAILGKMVTELHKLLVKDRRDNDHAKDSLIKELVKENAGHRKERAELFTRLEEARSADLERKILLEAHEKNQEMKDKATKYGIPAILAVANSIAGANLLPAADIKATSIQALADSLDEKQIEKWVEITGDADLVEKLEAAESGNVDIGYFTELLTKLDMAKVQAMYSILNPGQQLNLNSLAKLMAGPNAN